MCFYPIGQVVRALVLGLEHLRLLDQVLQRLILVVLLDEVQNLENWQQSEQERKLGQVEEGGHGVADRFGLGAGGRDEGPGFVVG